MSNQQPNEKKKIIGKTCKFASTHTVNRHIHNGKYKYDEDDLLLVKEEVFFDDGTSQSRLRFKENATRPFWIVKEAFRKFNTKREWIEKDKCDVYYTTDSRLDQDVCLALGRKQSPRANIRTTNRNPYVMGTDLTSAVWTRINYKQKYPEYHAKPNKVAVYDIETDVVGRYALNKEEFGDAIIGATVACGKHVLTCALRKFVEKKSVNPEKDFFKVLDRDMPDIRNECGFKVKFEMFDTELELLERIFQQLHRWQPDIVSCWNLSFDVPRTAERLKAWKKDPKDYFSDPRIPEKYKQYYFKVDKGQKISDSGRQINKLFYQLWHNVIAPSSFIWLDAACCYWFIRAHEGNLPSAKLDYILGQEIGRGKYEIPEAEGYKGLDKHIFMQENHPIEYMVYNSYDCIGILQMEEKNGDMTLTLPSLLGVSEYRQFSSSPTKVMNNFAEFEIFKRGNVPGTTSDAMKDDLDHYIVPQSNWIVALPTNSILKHGINAIEEYSGINTKIYTHNADLDVKSSYPTSTDIMNISRETTKYELVSIEGVHIADRYSIGLNMMASQTNAVRLSRDIYGLPTLQELLKIYDSD